MNILNNKGNHRCIFNYRFIQKVKVNQIIQDAAFAVKWVYDNVNKYGGDKKKIFLSLIAGGINKYLDLIKHIWISS